MQSLQVFHGSIGVDEAGLRRESRKMDEGIGGIGDGPCERGKREQAFLLRY